MARKTFKERDSIAAVRDSVRNASEVARVQGEVEEQKPKFSMDVAIAFAFGFIISLYALALFNQSTLSTTKELALTDSSGSTALVLLTSSIASTQYVLTILVLGVLLVVAGLQLAQISVLKRIPVTAVRKNQLPSTPRLARRP